MTKTEKLVELIDIISKSDGAIGEYFNEDGSVTVYDIVGICTDKDGYGECTGSYGEICLEIQPLEDDAVITVTDEYIEVTGSVSGKWHFYPDCVGDKSVFAKLIKGAEHK